MIRQQLTFSASGQAVGKGAVVDFVRVLVSTISTVAVDPGRPTVMVNVILYVVDVLARSQTRYWVYVAGVGMTQELLMSAHNKGLTWRWNPIYTPSFAHPRSWILLNIGWQRRNWRCRCASLRFVARGSDLRSGRRATGDIDRILEFGICFSGIVIVGRIFAESAD